MKHNSTSTAGLIMGVGLTAILVAAIVFGLTHFATASASPNATGSGTAVVAEVYGGAGCGTAGCSTYERDYIILLNRGTVNLSLNGRSVQYAEAGGTAIASQTNLPIFTLQPGQYYLIAEARDASDLSPLPIVPDVTGTIAISATAGKVFLVGNTTPLTLNGSGCPTSLATVIDFVGFGAANCSEGGLPAPAASTITSTFRVMNGCQDTDVNSADFVAQSPSPRNSLFILTCGVQAYPTLVKLVSTGASADDGIPLALGAAGVATLLGGGVWFVRRKRHAR